MSNLSNETTNETSFEERKAQQVETEAEEYCQEQSAASVGKTGSGEERIFGSQFTYSDYLFDGNSNSTSTELPPGPSSPVGQSALPSTHSAPHSTTSTLASPSLLSLPINSAPILNFALSATEEQALPHFSTHQPLRDTYLSRERVIVGSSANLPSNEYMLFDTSMLDSSGELSAMQETASTPTAISKVADFFTSPPPLQSALRQDSPNVSSMSQQQLSLEAHHVQSQSQTQQLQDSVNFVHFHQINGNRVSSGASGNHSEAQVPSDTNNNPVTEDLKESISGLLNESAPLSTSQPDSVATTSSTMDLGGHLTQQSQANQYMSSNAGQMLAQEHGIAPHQQTHNPQAASSSTSNEGQPTLLNIIPNNFTCYSNEPEMQQHGFGAGNEASLVNPRTPGQSSLLTLDDSSLYHSHHLSSMQQSQSQVICSQQASASSQQMNHHGQAMPLQHQSHHHQQHHPIAANALSASPMESYAPSQLHSSPSSSVDVASNTSNATLQQKSSHSINTSATTDSMLSQESSNVPLSVRGEIKSEVSYTSPAGEYLLSSRQGESSQYHQAIHQGEDQVCLPATSAALSSLAPPTTVPHTLADTAHSQTHYMPSSESLHASSSSNTVNKTTCTNVNTIHNSQGNAPGEPNNNISIGSTNCQILSGFEAMDSSPSGPPLSLTQQQPNCFVYEGYQKSPKALSSVQQMHFDVSQQQQAQSMQSGLSLNDPAVSTSHESSDIGKMVDDRYSNPNVDLLAAMQSQGQQMQQTLQQPQMLNSVSQQSSLQVHNDGPSQARPPSVVTSFSVSSNSMCISQANQVPASSMQSPQVSTVTLTSMSVSSGLRPVCVIADPNDSNGPSLPPLHPAPQAQVDGATFASLPPKKIRFASSVSPISPSNCSLSQSQVSAAPPALLFASKSSVPPSVPPSPQALQQAPLQSSSALNSNVIQAMILPSNIASFGQAQSIQSQIVQAIEGNLVTSISTSASGLHNVAVKPFVSSSGSTGQTYSTADIHLQARQFSPSSMPSSSASGTTASYSTPGVRSSIPSGSQFSRIQNMASSASLGAISSQGQVFYSSVPNTASIRLLEPSSNNIANMNYSIVALQPASVQSARQQQGAQASKNQTVSQKILLHSVPVSEANGNMPIAPAAALISLNSKFALSANPSQMATLGHLPALNNGPNSRGASQQLRTDSIILSPIPPSSANNPGSQATGAVTNFAVAIPVVTSAIDDSKGQSLTIASIQQAAARQFAPGAFVPSVTQPTILSSLLPASGASVPPALATKSNNKLLTVQPSKGASKTGNGSTSSTKNTSASISNTSKSFQPPPLMSDDPAKPFKCCLCGKNLASKNVYQLHLRSHSGEKPFSCQLCNNRFSQKTSLTRHMRSHTGERPFPCQVCNKRFADKERIKIHMRIHTGEKPFSCAICGKKFSQKSTVKRHMSVHTGVKPFKCEICGKGFANRGNLTAHQKTHQSGQHSQANQHVRTVQTLSSTASINQQQGVPMGHQTQPPVLNNGNRPTSIVYTSNAGASNTSAVSNSGVRVEIANIKTEVEDPPIDNRKSSNPHNHQFTSATRPPALSQGQPQQESHQPAALPS